MNNRRMEDQERSWPEFCCAILRDTRGRYLLEQRPTNKPHAGGLLVCFGGKREPNESPEACIGRELLEELGWEPGYLELAVRLVASSTGREVAWFYRGSAPVAPKPQEPGVAAAWLDAAELARKGTMLSDWHLAALLAEFNGQSVVRLSAPSPECPGTGNPTGGTHPV